VKIRIISLALVLAVFAEPSAATPVSVCVIDPQKLPESWQPPASVAENLSPAPWSRDEAKIATTAVDRALREITDYIERKPGAVEQLWDDSVEAVINITHAAADRPELVSKATKAGQKYLDELITISQRRSPSETSCPDFESLLPLSLLAHRLFQANDPRTIAITQRANSAIEACDDWHEIFGLDDYQFPPSGATELESLYDLIIWSLWLIETEVYPAIEIPAEATEFPANFWEYFGTYRFRNAREFDNGIKNDDFNETAEIATHLALIPTGSHRYPLYVRDLPDLFRFHRENFYAVLGSGDLDLLASFVDSLRQYGCTPANDVQVRDGTRTLLKYFHQSKDSWMTYRNPGEKKLDDYDLIHKAWTGAMGIRDRKPKVPGAGNYGGIVRQWLPSGEQ